MIISHATSLPSFDSRVVFNVGNIVGLKGLVWIVRFRCRGSCWCQLIFEFGIGVGVLAMGLLRLCGLSTFVDSAGGCD